MIDPAVVYHCWETGWEYWRNQSLYKRSHKTRSFGNANFYWIVRVWWSYETVRMSRTKFLTGTKSFKGAAKSDRPVTLRQSRANVSKVGEMIESDGRYTIRDVAKAVDISLSWVHLILKRILKVRKISAIYWWMTKKWVRVQTTELLLNCFPNSIKAYSQNWYMYCYWWRKMGTLFRTSKNTWKQYMTY